MNKNKGGRSNTYECKELENHHNFLLDHPKQQNKLLGVIKKNSGIKHIFQEKTFEYIEDTMKNNYGFIGDPTMVYVSKRLTWL